MLSSRQRAVSTVVSFATRIEAAGFHRMAILPSSSTAAPAKTEIIAEKSSPCSSASLLDDRNIQIDSKLKQYVLLNFSNKNYKDWDQVPHHVTSSEMDAARSRMRVHINLWIMFLGTAVCFAAALHFKRQNDSGALSWVESNIQEHNQWAKDFKKDH